MKIPGGDLPVLGAHGKITGEPLTCDKCRSEVDFVVDVPLKNGSTPRYCQPCFDQHYIDNPFKGGDK